MIKIITQVIKTQNGDITKLIAENDRKRITNKKYEYFLKTVFVGKNSNINDFIEVDYEIWGAYLQDEIPKTEADKINLKVDKVEEDVSVLQNETTTLNEAQASSVETDDVILCAIAENSEQQDALTDVLLCAVDDIYTQVEPLLEKNIDVNSIQALNIVSSGLSKLYLIMVKRNLKTLEEVPMKYRDYIKNRL